MRKDYYLSGLIIMPLLLCTFFLTNSCDGDDDSEGGITVKLNPGSVSLTPEKGSTATFDIQTKGSWSIGRKPSFAEVTPTMGEGNGTITVRATDNNETSQPWEDIIVIDVDGAEDSPFTVNVSQSGSGATDCYAEPQNQLVMCKSLGFNMKFGSNTKYFYWKFFKQSDYEKMSESEMLSQVVTGKMEDRCTPELDDVFCFYDLTEYTSYVAVTVAYAEGDKRGDIIVTPFTTKSNYNQPKAAITDFSYYTSNNNFYYGWTTEKNQYCSKYYAYAAASNEEFFTYSCADKGYTVLFLWSIRAEILKSGEDHSTTINTNMWGFDMGRDKLFGAMVNNGTSYLPCSYYSDHYFQVLTWGVDDSNEFSGIVDGRLYNFDHTPNQAPQMKLVERKDQNKDVPGQARLNRNNIILQRIQ